MVTINHSIGLIHVAIGVGTSRSPCSSLRQNSAKPSLRILLCIKPLIPCNMISIFLTFQSSGSRETTTLVVLWKRPQWCFLTLLNFLPSVFLQKALVAVRLPLLNAKFGRLVSFLLQLSASPSSACALTHLVDLSSWTPGHDSLRITEVL